MKNIKILFSLSLLTILPSCANYSTNAGVTFDSLKVPKENENILIVTKAELPQVEYTSLGEVEAMVRSRNMNGRGPSYDQANFVLRKLAKEENADAVINVKYEYDLSIWTFWNWSTLSATGELIKFKKVDKK